MSKILLVGLVVAALGLLGAGFAIPAFAHEPGGGEATFTNQEMWDAMHEACEVGDWDSMAEATREIHGEGLGYMPCHDEDYHAPEEGGPVPTDPWGSMWSHMGGGMMDWE